MSVIAGLTAFQTTVGAALAAAEDLPAAIDAVKKIVAEFEPTLVLPDTTDPLNAQGNAAIKRAEEDGLINDT